MNKKGMNVGIVIVLFMGVIIALALLGAIADRTQEMTTMIPASQTIDISTARNIEIGGNNVNITSSNTTATKAPAAGSWERTNCPLTLTSYGNASTNWTSGTGFNFYGSTGILQVLNASQPVGSNTNTTFLRYSYCGEGYQPTSAARTVAGLILLFAILGIIAFAFWSLSQGSGLFGGK